MKTNLHPEEIKFSLFLSPKGIKETIPTRTLSLDDLNKFIHHDDCCRLSIPVYSCYPDELPFLKSKLPFITPNGVFSKRGKEFIQEFNATILPIDIDQMDKDKAILLRNFLGRMKGCIYASVSPSRQGVKALFLLSDPIPWETFSETLKINKELIEHELALDCFDVSLDAGQWNKAQSMFIPYDDYFFNTNPEPINIPLKKPIIRHVNDTINVDSMTIESQGNIRLCRYMEMTINNTINDIVNAQQGHRHEAIGKVMKVSSIIHYTPHLRQLAYDKLKQACQYIYPDNPPEGTRCFLDAWKNAETRQNETLNEILLSYGKSNKW